jgi:hypothetical protein
MLDVKDVFSGWLNTLSLNSSTGTRQRFRTRPMYCGCRSLLLSTKHLILTALDASWIPFIILRKARVAFIFLSHWIPLLYATTAQLNFTAPSLWPTGKCLLSLVKARFPTTPFSFFLIVLLIIKQVIVCKHGQFSWDNKPDVLRIPLDKITPNQYSKYSGIYSVSHTALWALHKLAFRPHSPLRIGTVIVPCFLENTLLFLEI